MAVDVHRPGTIGTAAVTDGGIVRWIRVRDFGYASVDSGRRPGDVPGGDAMRIAAMLAAALLSSFAVPAQAQNLPEIGWKVSSRFPQYREDAGPGSPWRTPYVSGGTSVLPLPEELSGPPENRWGKWYERLAAPGQSPYADWIGTRRDVWDESEQHYRPEFLDYVRSDRIWVSLSVPSDIAPPASCAWQIDAEERRADPGCRGIEAKLPLHDDDGGPIGATVTLYDGERPVARSQVRARRLIVLALGDSYASGEGNPDVPTRWNEAAVAPGVAYHDPDNLEWLRLEHDRKNPHVHSQAKWRDARCHRSFWNQQNFAAMALAAQDSGREVVFLQFSCSGAEALDGLLVRQLDPPGIGEFDKAGCGIERDPDCRIAYSQLAAAATALCREQPKPLDRARLQSLKQRIKRHGPGHWDKLNAYYRKGQPHEAPYGLDLLTCASPVEPDLVLLSLGGNDAGFASLVAWALMPYQPRYWRVSDEFNFFNALRAFAVICPDQDRSWVGCNGRRADAYARQLRLRYGVFGSALKASNLVDEPRRVVLSSYPDPLRMRKDPQTGVAALCADESGKPSPWYALNLFVPGAARSAGNWDFALRNSGEGRNNRAPEVLTEHVLPGIRAALRESAKAQGYTYVGGIETAFEGRSWCDEAPEERGRLGLPSDPRTAWNGSPASWRPYAPRARAIRTANDSYMTQLSERSGDKNGAMHPTAEGHMLMAAQIYLAAAGILDEAAAPSANRSTTASP